MALILIAIISIPFILMWWIKKKENKQIACVQTNNHYSLMIVSYRDEELLIWNHRFYLSGSEAELKKFKKYWKME